MKAYNHAAAVARKQEADTCMNSSCHESKQAVSESMQGADVTQALCMSGGGGEKRVWYALHKLAQNVTIRWLHCIL